MRTILKMLTHGVIGNTADFGSVILGSSPSGSTIEASSELQNGLFLFHFCTNYNKPKLHIRNLLHENVTSYLFRYSFFCP